MSAASLNQACPTMATKAALADSNSMDSRSTSSAALRSRSQASKAAAVAGSHPLTSSTLAMPRSLSHAATPLSAGSMSTPPALCLPLAVPLILPSATSTVGRLDSPAKLTSISRSVRTSVATAWTPRGEKPLPSVMPCSLSHSAAAAP